MLALREENVPNVFIIFKILLMDCSSCTKEVLSSANAKSRKINQIFFSRYRSTSMEISITQGNLKKIPFWSEVTKPWTEPCAEKNSDDCQINLPTSSEYWKQLEFKPQ